MRAARRGGGGEAREREGAHGERARVPRSRRLHSRRLRRHCADEVPTPPLAAAARSSRREPGDGAIERMTRGGGRHDTAGSLGYHCQRYQRRFTPTRMRLNGRSRRRDCHSATTPPPPPPRLLEDERLGRERLGLKLLGERGEYLGRRVREERHDAQQLARVELHDLVPDVRDHLRRSGEECGTRRGKGEGEDQKQEGARAGSSRRRNAAVAPALDDARPATPRRRATSCRSRERRATWRARDARRGRDATPRAALPRDARSTSSRDHNSTRTLAARPQLLRRRTPP